MHWEIITQQHITITTPEESANGFCMACQQQASLMYMGQQEWPAKVAAAMGISPIVTLWRCGHCYTTITVGDDAI